MGLARDCRHRGGSGGAVSPNLTPFTPAVSEPGAQVCLSPLRLPISPPGHRAGRILSHVTERGVARLRSPGMVIFSHGAKPLNLRDSRAK